MLRGAVSLLLTFILIPCLNGEEAKVKTKPLAFVNEFLREMKELDETRASGEKEIGETKEATQRFMIMIHVCTEMVNELTSHINMLSTMDLGTERSNKTLEFLIVNDGLKAADYRRLKEISVAFLSKQDPQQDYGKLAAALPEIRANIEDIDKSIATELSMLVYSTMLDTEHDTDHFLLIKKKDKQALIARINDDFGAPSPKAKLSYFAFAASKIRTAISGVKALDE